VITLNKLNKLKMIFRLGSGIDNIDLKEAKKKKIKILKTKVSLEKAVGELTIALILNILRKISNQDQNMKKGIWKKEMGNLLYDKTVGIIGYGKIGKYLSKILKIFGAKILIYDIKKNKHNITLKKLLTESEIITIHTSYTKKNFNFIDKKKMKLMRKDSILINTSRPEIIDYKYLYYMLKKKIIKAAALDVFKKEPYKGKFTKLSNVLLTPHIGSYAQEIRDKMELEAVESIVKY
jgi:D-3-phosphoglycerate dehydrogenase